MTKIGRHKMISYIITYYILPIYRVAPKNVSKFA